MRTQEEVFDAWVPEPLDGPRWTDWAKPVLFATMRFVSSQETPAEGESLPDVSWAPDPSEMTTVVVNLPGVDSVRMGVALALRGYRPVPLYNGTPGVASSLSALDVSPIASALVRHAATVRGAKIQTDAPPAFLIDSQRCGSRRPNPGVFDNRWIVLPQDFPSANRLLAEGVRRAIIAQSHEHVQQDLAHAMLRWRKAGVEIDIYDVDDARMTAANIPRPSRFGAIWYTALALVGLRRNSAGGFGSVVPQPSQGHGYG